MSEKIKPQHLARKAMLYVRQSSTYQVNHNLESQRLQYAMQDRLHDLGLREIRGDGHVPGALDEVPKPVVVALLRTGRGRHRHDHRSFPHTVQLLEDDGVRPTSEWRQLSRESAKCPWTQLG